MSAIATAKLAAIDLGTVSPRDLHALVFSRGGANSPQAPSDSCCSGRACCG